MFLMEMIHKAIRIIYERADALRQEHEQHLAMEDDKYPIR